MRDEINRKVINIFSRHNNELPPETKEKVKFYPVLNSTIDKDHNVKNLIRIICKI
jgi:hypothetical protein